MKTASRKAKGRKLQDLVRDKLKKAFNFTDDDVRCAIMGETGADVKLTKRAANSFPYNIECKNQEGFTSVYRAYGQACDHRVHGEPLLIIKMNRKPPLAIVDLDVFIELVTHGERK